MSAPEFEAVVEQHFYDTGWRCECGWTGSAEEWTAHLAAALNAEVARWAKGLVIPLFDAATKAASPDDWAGHLPNCGYSDDGPACGCADYGRRLLAAIRGTLAALAPTADEKGAGR